MLNIVYCTVFVVLFWIPFVYCHTVYHGFSLLQVLVTLFNAINCLICLWEISLYRNAALIKETHDKTLKPKYGKKLPEGCVLFDDSSQPVHQGDDGPLSLRHWSQIWSVYSLLDDAYSDSKSFGFWIDVGNGHCFLFPTLFFSIVMTFDVAEIASWLPSIVTEPRNQALVACVCNYVMMHGTFLYFAQYLYNKRYDGHSAANVAIVVFANFLWILFPSMAIYACYDAVQTNDWTIVRG